MKTNKLIVGTGIILLSVISIFAYNIKSTNRNDIQHYTTDNQDYCINKFKNDNNIVIRNINGISMQPTLYQDMKIVCDSSIEEYEEGMIISYKNDNQNITHRIKGVYSNYIITQGDDNLYEDNKVNYSQVNCVVIGVCY